MISKEKEFRIPPRLDDALAKKMCEANTMCWRWEGKVAMRAEDRKAQVQRKEKEEREEKEAQRRAAAVKAAEEWATKARDIEKESAEGSKKQPEVLKEGVEGSKKLADAPKEVSSGAFGVSALVASLGVPLAKLADLAMLKTLGGRPRSRQRRMWVPMHHLNEGYEGWSPQDYHRFLSW